MWLRCRPDEGEVITFSTKGKTMYTSTYLRRHTVMGLAAALIVVAGAASPAAARPDPGTSSAAQMVTSTAQRCRLARVGTQHVRCDDHTGANVTAPSWVPEF